MATTILETFTLDANNPVKNLGSYFADGAMSSFAIPNTNWEIFTTNILVAVGSLVTAPEGHCHDNPPVAIGTCAPYSRIFPFGTLFTTYPTDPIMFIPDGEGGGSWNQLFDPDNHLVIFEPLAGSSLDVEFVIIQPDFICWTLSYRLLDGRFRSMNGPGRYPSIIEVEPDADLTSCVLVEDGIVIPPSMYRARRMGS